MKDRKAFTLVELFGCDRDHRDSGGDFIAGGAKGAGECKECGEQEPPCADGQGDEEL